MKNFFFSKAALENEKAANLNFQKIINEKEKELFELFNKIKLLESNKNELI